MERSNIRTCIITGANSGIGKSAAAELAAKGLRMILACRNMAQAERVCQEIRSTTGNEQIFARRVDLMLTADVCRFAKEFIEEFASLDILINNAADFDLARKAPLMSRDGNEAQFATNLLAPFLLMERLLPLLKQSKDGRIINIASKGLMVYPNLTFDFDNMQAEKSYSPAKTYYQTKLGLLMISLAMRRFLAASDVSVYAIRVPNVKVDMSRYPNISPILKFAYGLKSKLAISPKDMAKAYAALAVGEKRKGFYYDEKLNEVRCNKNAYDQAAQERLWGICEQVAGFKGRG